MKVHLVNKIMIEKFARDKSQSRASLNLWVEAIEQADWNVAIDMLQTFTSADLLGNGSNRVVFDIGGNRFKIIGRYHFDEAMVHLVICWIGTRTQYTKLRNNGKQYTIRHL